MHNRLTLRYLGVAGWHFATPTTSILIDPYFTRASMWQVLTTRLKADRAAIEAHTPPADAIFITHPHYDHIADTPLAFERAEAPVYASAQGCRLLEALGVPDWARCPLRVADHLVVGDISVTVHLSQHRKIFGRVPSTGDLTPDLTPPLRARDYRIQQVFSLLVEAAGVRTLVTSGIDAEPRLPADVLLVGPDTDELQLWRIAGPAQPQIIMPTHWDDMFRPLTKPIRSMVKPPKHLFSLLRRMDLERWTAMARTVIPDGQVIIPEHFTAYDLSHLLGRG